MPLCVLCLKVFFFIVFSSRHLLCLLLCFVSWESKRLWATGFELFASGVEFVLWKAVCLLRLFNLSCALKFAPPRDIYMSKKNQQNSFRMSPTCLLKQIKSFSWRWQHEAGQHCGSSPFFFHLSQQRLSGAAGWSGIITTQLLFNNSGKGGCRQMLSMKKLFNPPIRHLLCSRQTARDQLLSVESDISLR